MTAARAGVNSIAELTQALFVLGRELGARALPLQGALGPLREQLAVLRTETVLVGLELDQLARIGPGVEDLQRVRGKRAFRAELRELRSGQDRRVPLVDAAHLRQVRMLEEDPAAGPLRLGRQLEQVRSAQLRRGSAPG